MLAELLESVDLQPTPGRYAEVARRLDEVSEWSQRLRVAMLASFTVEPLVPYFRVEAARHGFFSDIYVAPFNTVGQELLDPHSGCSSHAADIVFVAELLEDVCPRFVERFLALSPELVEQEIERAVSERVTAIAAFRQRSAAAVVVHNFAVPPPALGIYEASAEQTQTAAIRRLNNRLAAALRGINGVSVLDYDRLCSEVGHVRVRDWKMWYLARAPFSPGLLPPLARTQALFARAIHGAPKKCLVVDLDNTLWGGIIGEDGVSGIKLGPSYPGNVFRAFQQQLLQLHDRGVLLAVNSKNNASDVDEVFRTHPDMVLRAHHFAVRRINWQHKPENMVEIARELNIGLDSLVFFDDNPAERALMRRALPQVLTLEVPQDPIEYAGALQRCGAFERLGYTGEDRQRTQMYRDQHARVALQQNAGSLEDFLQNLKMRAAVALADDFTLPRMADLVQKTNQFNLTTRRRTQAELATVAASPSWGVFGVRLADRFGDQGLVGVAIVNVAGGQAELDTFLLSCRVIGRRVETALLRAAVDWAISKGAKSLQGEFIPTPKNAPARDFLLDHAMTEVWRRGDHYQCRLDLHSVPFTWPAFIELGNDAAWMQPA